MIINITNINSCCRITKAAKLIFVTLIAFQLTSCMANPKDKEEKYPGLNVMLDYYYNYHGDYPANLTEFKQYTQDAWFCTQFIDTLVMTLRELENDSDDISWQKDDDFPQNHLLIMRFDDTLAYRINEHRFPSIDDFINSYTHCYGEYPLMLDDLVAFETEALKVTKHSPFWKYDSLTVGNLRTCQELGILLWSMSDDGLLIKVRNDTIADWKPSEGKNGFCYIPSDEIVFFSPCFYNQNGVYTFCEDTIIDVFKNSLRNLRVKYCKNQDITGWCLLKYTKEHGIFHLCNNADVPLETDWFIAVGDYVRDFATQKGFSSIIFSCPYY